MYPAQHVLCFTHPSNLDSKPSWSTCIPSSTRPAMATASGRCGASTRRARESPMWVAWCYIIVIVIVIAWWSPCHCYCCWWWWSYDHLVWSLEASGLKCSLIKKVVSHNLWLTNQRTDCPFMVVMVAIFCVMQQHGFTGAECFKWLLVRVSTLVFGGSG